MTDTASVWRACAWAEDWTAMCPLEPEIDLRLEDSTAMAAWEAVVEEKDFLLEAAVISVDIMLDAAAWLWEEN